MQYITLATLTQLGINLPADKQDEIIDHLNSTLAERIGAEVIESLDDDKAEELVNLQEDATPAEVSSWLQANIEELKDIIEDEYNILLGEVVDEKDNLAAV